jgi:hypothetical protein
MKHCCYESCCPANEHKYGIYASICTYSLALTTDTCTDYRLTECCPKKVGYYTSRFTCCSKSPAVNTYGECRGEHYTDYCTISYKTYCCYSSCCGQWNRKRALKTCGFKTCSNYRSTYCCGRGYFATCCNVQTYTSCPGKYYTDQCTNTRSTLCCYNRCCESRGLKASPLSTCGITTCSIYESKYCCKPGDRCCDKWDWYRSSTVSTRRDDAVDNSSGSSFLM